MIELISGPWPWYVAGPLIGLTVPLLLWAGGEFGVSENLRHICAAVLPTRNDFFRYDWCGPPPAALTPHNLMSTAVAGWPVAWVTMSAYSPT